MILQAVSLMGDFGNRRYSTYTSLADKRTAVRSGTKVSRDNRTAVCSGNKVSRDKRVVKHSAN